MTTRRTVWIAALAGLLILGSLANQPVEQQAPVAVNAPPDIRQAVATLDANESPAPIATAFLEAVLLQGGLAQKRAAIRELRHLGTPEAIQALSLALGDDDSHIREAAMEALAAVGGDDAAGAIGSLAGDLDPRVRADATLSLAMIGGDSAVEYLKLALHDPDPIVRLAAINSLADVGDDYSVAVIQQAFQDEDELVRERALELVDEMNDDAAFRALYPPLSN